MKLRSDSQVIERAASLQGGVFSTADLQSCLADRHAAGFKRRVAKLLEDGALRRFCRGFYIAGSFDLSTLSQRIDPHSVVSFGTVLARHLLIGSNPERQVLAVKPGKSRTYTGAGVEIVHLHLAPHLFFGWIADGGVRFADPEKAVLDVLYFHLRGRRYPFDVYSDVEFGKLDARTLNRYLSRYRNPKFVGFARSILQLS